MQYYPGILRYLQSDLVKLKNVEGVRGNHQRHDHSKTKESIVSSQRFNCLIVHPHNIANSRVHCFPVQDSISLNSETNLGHTESSLD